LRSKRHHLADPFGSARLDDTGKQASICLPVARRKFHLARLPIDRFWLFPDVALGEIDVRFTPETGHHAGES